MNKSTYDLIIETETWAKDSNELFDYETKDLQTFNTTTNFGGCIYRQKNSIEYTPETRSHPWQRLLDVNCNKNSFFINNYKNANSKVFEESLWIVAKFHNLKNEYSQGYKLTKGDVIKLGRVKLRVKELKYCDPDSDDQCESKLELEQNTVPVNTENKQDLIKGEIQKKKKKANVCRICYCDDKEVNSPLLVPCHCSGSMKYIHFSCLQTWLKSKITVKTSSTNLSTSYCLKQIPCELCKTIFPDFVKYNGAYYDVWDFVQHNYKTYITFESIPFDKSSNRTIFTVNMEYKQSIKMGRGNDSDIRISDISVSRFHAIIEKTKTGEFILTDNDSKFGSLAMLQSQNLVISNKTLLPLQCGRSLVLMKTVPKFSFLRCLGCEKIDAVAEYNAANAAYVKSLSHYRNLKDQDQMNENSVDEEGEMEKSLLIEEIKKKKAEVNFDNNPLPAEDTHNNIFEVINADQDIADNVHTNQNTVLETFADNHSPDRKVIKSLGIMKSIIDDNKTQNEDTEQNEDSSLRIENRFSGEKIIDKFAFQDFGRQLSGLSKSKTVNNNPHLEEVIEEKSVVNVSEEYSKVSHRDINLSIRDENDKNKEKDREFKDAEHNIMQMIKKTKLPTPDEGKSMLNDNSKDENDENENEYGRETNPNEAVGCGTAQFDVDPFKGNFIDYSAKNLISVANESNKKSGDPTPKQFDLSSNNMSIEKRTPNLDDLPSRKINFTPKELEGINFDMMRKASDSHQSIEATPVKQDFTTKILKTEANPDTKKIENSDIKIKKKMSSTHVLPKELFPKIESSSPTKQQVIVMKKSTSEKKLFLEVSSSANKEIQKELVNANININSEDLSLHLNILPTEPAKRKSIKHNSENLIYFNESPDANNLEDKDHNHSFETNKSKGEPQC